jgi:hypothetical protein
MTIRDNIHLVSLSSIVESIALNASDLQSFVAVLVDCKPVYWKSSKSKSNKKIECYDFYVSDDKVSYIKITCWGATAMHAASTLPLYSICLFDRVQFFSIDGEIRGRWLNSETTSHVLTSRSEVLLFDCMRYEYLSSQLKRIQHVHNFCM